MLPRSVSPLRRSRAHSAPASHGIRRGAGPRARPYSCTVPPDPGPRGRRSCRPPSPTALTSAISWSSICPGGATLASRRGRSTIRYTPSAPSSKTWPRSLGTPSGIWSATPSAASSPCTWPRSGPRPCCQLVWFRARHSQSSTVWSTRCDGSESSPASPCCGG